MAENTTRRVNIYVNGQEVENSFKAINKELTKSRNELAYMTIGSKQYIEQLSKVRQLQGIIDEHKNALKGTNEFWKRMKENAMAFATGDLISQGIQNLGGLIKRTFTNALDSFKTFQTGYVRTISLMSDAQTNELGESLQQGTKELIRMTGSVEDVSQAMELAVSSGIDAADAVDFLTEANETAIGTNTELETTIDGLTNVINAYGLEASEAENISNAFFTAQNYGKTTVKEIAKEIGDALPYSSALGVSYQEVLAALSDLTAKGVKTPQAVTAIKGALTALLNPSKEAAAVMTQLGVPFGVTGIKAEGFEKTLRKLGQVYREQPDLLAKAIPTQEGQVAILTLMNDNMEAYSRNLQAIRTDVGENTALSRAYALQQETNAVKEKKALGELQVLYIELGEKLGPLWVKLLSLAGQLSRMMIALIDWLARSGDTLMTWAKALGLVVTTIVSYTLATKLAVLWTERATAATAAKSLVDKIDIILTAAKRGVTLALAAAYNLFTGNLTKATQAMRAFNTATKGNLIGIVTAAIATAAVAIYEYTESVSEAKKESTKFFGDFFSQMTKEKKNIEDTFLALKQTTAGTRQRSEAIKMVNEQYGQYLPNLLTEKSTIADIEKAQKAATDALIANIAVKTKQGQMEQVFASTREAEQEHLTNLLEIYREATDGQRAGDFVQSVNDVVGAIMTGSTTYTEQMALVDKLNKDYGITQRQGYRIGLENITRIVELRQKEKSVMSDLDSFYKQFIGTVKEASTATQQEQTTQEEITPLGKYTDADTQQAAEKQLSEIQRLEAEYAQKIREIRDGLRTANLDGMDKEITALNVKYRQMLDVVQGQIGELSTQQGEEEQAILVKFKEQEQQLYELYNAESLAIYEKYTAEYQKKQKENAQRVQDALMSEREREVQSIRAKYAELIALAGENSNEAILLRQKMNAELDALAPERDIFGMTEADWGSLMEKVNKAKELIGAIASAWGNYDAMQTNRENAALSRETAANDKKKEEYQRMLDKKRISEAQYNKRVAALDEELDAKKRKIAHDQAVRSQQQRIYDATLGQLAGIVEIWAKYAANPIYAGILTGIMLTATGLNIAAIKAEELPAYAEGARISKPTIGLIGEAGPELILSNRILSDPYTGPIAERLAQIQEGRAPRVPQGNSMASSTTTVPTYVPVPMGNGNNGAADMQSVVSTLEVLIQVMNDKLNTINAVISNDELLDHEKKIASLKNYAKL